MDRRLRIVHYLPAIRLADGGVARAVLDWCKVFAERGHEVILLCHTPTDVPQDWLERKPGCPRTVVIPLPGSGLKISAQLQMGQGYLKLIQQADVLHLHAPWLLEHVVFARMARKHHVPYVLSVHGMLDDWSMSQRRLKKRIYLLVLGRRILNKAAAIHCTAEAEKTQASKWFSNPKIAVLPYLVDLDPFRQLPGPDLAMRLLEPTVQKQPKLLFLSRLHEKKGLDVLIRASGLLRDAGVEAVTLIAGTGDAAYEQYLRDLVLELGLTSRVLFLGLVTGEQKISLYQAADVFVLPTHQENFGLVLTEALACGTSVVTTKGTDIWQELEGAGAIIAERTPEAFAAEMRKLLENPQDRADRGQRGRDWVLSTLAVEPLSEQYEAMYRSLVHRNGSPNDQVPKSQSNPGSQ